MRNGLSFVDKISRSRIQTLYSSN
uniref:Uncharacterized protein n=1 Tax=Arundo donax TaxID=35708 RepID=A0A0A8YV01_ARUDO